MSSETFPSKYWQGNRSSQLYVGVLNLKRGQYIRKMRRKNTD